MYKLFCTLILSVLSINVAASETLISNAPDNAKVYFITPADGDIVGEKVMVKFGLRGMGVAPAGIARENTGHHHLIINGEVPAAGQPMGSQVQHFGGGQTETTLTLPKGQHTLQLILGNHLHIPHNPPVVSDKITITVQ